MSDPNSDISQKPATWKQVPVWQNPEIPASGDFGRRHLGLTLALAAWCGGLAWFVHHLRGKQAGPDQWVAAGIAMVPAVALWLWAFRYWRRRIRYGRPVFHMATWPGTNAQGELLGTIAIPRQRLPFTKGHLDIVCLDERQVGERRYSTIVWDACLPLQPESTAKGVIIPVSIRIPKASPDASPDPETPLRFAWFLRLGPEGPPAELEFLLPMFREDT